MALTAVPILPAVSSATVGSTSPLLRRKIIKLNDSRSRVCAIAATKKVSPRINSMVSAWMTFSKPCKVKK